MLIFDERRYNQISERSWLVVSNSTSYHVFEIVSRKHDQQLHRKWEENILFFKEKGKIIGGNYRTKVTEVSGKQWRTIEPVLFCFDNTLWFNIVVIFHKNSYYYYCNLSSPCIYNGKKLEYIDYDIDVIVQSDYTYEIVDCDEYTKNSVKYSYTTEIKDSLIIGLKQLQERIRLRKDPFNEFFIKKWTNHLRNYQSWRDETSY